MQAETFLSLSFFAKSSIEILSKNLYNYYNENNVIRKEDVK